MWIISIFLKSFKILKQGICSNKLRCTEKCYLLIINEKSPSSRVHPNLLIKISIDVYFDASSKKGEKKYLYYVYKWMLKEEQLKPKFGERYILILFILENIFIDLISFIHQF